MTVQSEAAPRAATGREFNLREALEELVRRGGSDLHLKVK